MRLHHRRSVRLDPTVYTGGAYFVTVCTFDRRFAFGSIRDGMMHLSEFGEIVVREWLHTPLVRPNVTLDEYQVMPNHFHAILFLAPPPTGEESNRGPLWRARRSLATTVGGFKGAVTAAVNAERGTPGRPVWQPGYYEHVIRREEELEAIRRYVVSNPQCWEDDTENPTRKPGPTRQRQPWEAGTDA